MIPTRRFRAATKAFAVCAVLLVSAACGEDTQGSNTDPEQLDSVEAPDLGVCRVLSPADVALPSNATRTVDCAEDHTAQTFAVGNLPAELDDATYDSEDMGAFAFDTCAKKFMGFLGADESLVMRSIVSWAWFRPSEKAWDEGARWYRCDIVGGSDTAEAYTELPKTAEGLLLKPDDRWMVCVNGESIADEKNACSEEHTWRAVTTIVLGDADEPYPGDRLTEVKTRDFCSDSVGAWLSYPVDYDFAYTWFHEAEWKAGNRRSVCWARTEE